MTDIGRKNIFVLDLLRVLCIIWIVVIWHGNDYLPIDYHYNESAVYLDHVTTMVLALFSLLSGMLLSKYRFASCEDVELFYKKRFSRFYVLFFIAVLSFYLLGFYTFKTSIKFGVSVYWGQKPFTLWYMSMLMTFYLITPLMRFSYSKRCIRAIIAIACTISMAALYYVGKLDNSVLLYFLSYSIGLYVGDYLLAWLRTHELEVSSIIRKGVEIIAYASFCMYLYHRVIFYAIGKITGYANEGIVFSMPIWCNVVAIVITIGISYYIQQAYDKILNNLHKK